MPVSLSQLLALPEIHAHARLPGAAASAPVHGVTSSSQEAGPGIVFFAVRGSAADGHSFVSEALAKGALAAIGQDALSPAPANYLAVPDSRAALAAAAALLHGYPARKLRAFGVTGTSGKTTSAFLLESILRAAGLNPGLIGTIETRFNGKAKEASHTTPGPVHLQALLAEMVAGGCRSLAMEVSSHALHQRRVGSMEFQGALFTNLSREHLDYHSDMDDYFAAKALLFEQHLRPGGAAAIGCDDRYGTQLVQRVLALPAEAQVVAFGPRAELAGLPPHPRLETLPIDDLQVTLEGIRGTLSFSGGARLQIRSELVARFNALNIAGAAALAHAAAIAPAAIERGIAEMRAVPGRLERVTSAAGIHVLVDYAHKPDALEKVLRTFQDARQRHRLITVFGCGGDRDRTKRPVMGQIAEDLSDQVFVTSDNPRTEEPPAIIRDILAGMKRSNHAVDPDRRAAIHAAIRAARPGDIVLIAGKGHEDYQILGKRKIHFDDREVAREALASEKS